MSRLDIQELFRQHHQELQGYLRRRGVSPELAADLTQEAFLRLLRTPADMQVQNASAYLFRTVKNLSVDWARRQRFLPWASDQEAALAAAMDETPSVERLIISRQELALLQAALNEIPAAVRYVFFARLEGMTFAEIGQRLGMSPNTAFSQMNRVLIFLKRHLDVARGEVSID